MEEAVATAQREPAPDPNAEDWCALATAAFDATASPPDHFRDEITYLEAIREAQARALADDPRVYIYGQDVGDFGGAFKATKNLAQEFPGRVLDAPDQRGRDHRQRHRRGHRGHAPDHRDAVRGFLDRRVQPDRQHAATLHWRTQVPCPITIRLPTGGTAGSGPFHSQSMEALYAHYPGLIVMTPATVEDAYTMLLEAVAIDDPVIFCEHKYLYYHLKADALPTEAMPTGKARIARAGRDATIVTYSAMVHEALAWPRNWPRKAGRSKSSTCAPSSRSIPTPSSPRVARTGRLLAVGEAWPWGGVTAEVIARVASEGFGLLDAAAHAPERQRHARALPPQPLGHASPHRAHHRRRRARTSAALKPFRDYN